MIILKPTEALSQWNAHLKASLKKSYEYYPTTLEASNCLYYGENRVVFAILNADRLQQTLYGKTVDQFKNNQLGERIEEALVAMKPLLQLEMKLPPAVFAALWAKRITGGTKELDLLAELEHDGKRFGVIENDDITHVLSDAAADELARGVSLPTLRAASESDSPADTNLMLAPEAMAKKDAFHRQFIAMRKAQPYAPLKKLTVLIQPNRVLFGVWNSKTQKCLAETVTEVSHALFDALWAKRDSSKCVVTKGIHRCMIDESNVSTILQSAVQATL